MDMAVKERTEIWGLMDMVVKEWREIWGLGLSKMHPRKPAFSDVANAVNAYRIRKIGGPSRDRLVYVMSCLRRQPVEVHVKNGSIISGIFHGTNNEKDCGILLKMVGITKDGSSRVQKLATDTINKPRPIIILAEDLFQVIAKDVSLTSDNFITEHAHERRKDLLVDSAISHPQHVDLGKELERWVHDKDDLELIKGIGDKEVLPTHYDASFLVAQDCVGANGFLQMHGSASEKSSPSKGQSSNTDMLQRKSANPKSTAMLSVDGTVEQKCDVLDGRRNIIAMGRVHNDFNQMTSHGISFNKEEEVLIVDVIYNGGAELYAPNSFADVLNDVRIGGFMKWHDSLIIFV